MCYHLYRSSVSNNKIFRNSDIFKNIIRDRVRFLSENQFIIGDNAYPLYMWCITPYIDISNLQAHHLHFNKRHTQTRQVIERSFLHFYLAALYVSNTLI
ncbi:hypothetical protein NQ314_001738 [Rhamnusium bicolor]|uniref:DDE Tnp4 domain-containing protein n=1 Tax=Rhamnusium bicolor TaxID=1586634 RepID=A0AAV8ZRF8_9CUCU|nr:hypothetical protein NQ314_001738 [Rhamnusium bicolor]